MRAGLVEQARIQATRSVEANYRDKINNLVARLDKLEARLQTLELQLMAKGGDTNVEMD